MPRAVAVDFGAGSGRIAIGELLESRIEFTVVQQIGHEPRMKDGLLRWDFETLLALCKNAISLAEDRSAASVGIDSWGVDIGFLDRNGTLIGTPVCYRDLSHLGAFESLAPHRRRLFEITGIQHQPFNTICQLVARSNENPAFSESVADWMILPDLLGYVLSGSRNNELTQASTTQLMGLECNWSSEAFEIAGWPLPSRRISSPGSVVNRLPGGVDLVSVGSHDTASAVVGFGSLEPTDLFLNMGTWSLFGSVIEESLVSQEAEIGGFSNERTVDGKIRFLKNIPGFYFINRLHEELGIQSSVPEWLGSASEAEDAFDLFHPDFFNPNSMLETCRKRLACVPTTHAGWAATALDSLVFAVARTATQLSGLTGKSYTKIRVGGGGSQSRQFCQRLTNRMRLPVIAGPVEATVLGNLALQFFAQGWLHDWEEVYQAIDRSIKQEYYSPE